MTGGRPRYDSFADGYSSMGDIDWKKRGGYDNWINPGNYMAFIWSQYDGGNIDKEQ